MMSSLVSSLSWMFEVGYKPFNMERTKKTFFYNCNVGGCVEEVRIFLCARVFHANSNLCWIFLFKPRRDFNQTVIANFLMHITPRPQVQCAVKGCYRVFVSHRLPIYVASGTSGLIGGRLKKDYFNFLHIVGNTPKWQWTGQVINTMRGGHIFDKERCSWPYWCNFHYMSGFWWLVNLVETQLSRYAKPKVEDHGISWEMMSCFDGRLSSMSNLICPQRIWSTWLF